MHLRLNEVAIRSAFLFYSPVTKVYELLQYKLKSRSNNKELLVRTFRAVLSIYCSNICGNLLSLFEFSFSN